MSRCIFDPVRDDEFPIGCPSTFREPILVQGKFSYESFRLLYQAVTYGDVELINGEYWEPPFSDKLPYRAPAFIVAVGGSGMGKTRSVWQCFRYDPQYIDFKCIRGVDLAQIIPAKAKKNDEGDGSLQEWMDEMSAVEILYIDDIGQCPLKGRVIVELWNLIDRRYANQKRTIISTNARRGVDLIEAVNYEDNFRIKTMLRRIRESCMLVDFDKARAVVVRAGVTKELILPRPEQLGETEEVLRCIPPINSEQPS